MLGISSFFLTVFWGCVWCVDGGATTDAGPTFSLLYTTLEAKPRTDTLPNIDGFTTPHFKASATPITPESFRDSNSTRIMENTTNISTSTVAPTGLEPSRYGEIHWLLFTGWQMPLVMVCVEILAYCVTLFIVFGFGQQRSRVKRFGRFSWKRPNPYHIQEEIPLNTIEHYVGTTATDSAIKVRKPSVRGHRP